MSEELAADTLQVSGPNGKRVSLSGPRILLPPREALAIAMALHELYTNAVKYGALSNDAGRIELAWRRSADAPARIELVWREDGGPPVAPRSAVASARCCSNGRSPTISMEA